MFKTAMILAAGRGSRLGDLTANTPKPLLHLGKHRLIEYALYRLAEAGVERVVINLHYLADQIMNALGGGERYGVEILYSHEDVLLGAGGGIKNALPLIGTDPFLLMSADLWSLYPLHTLNLSTGEKGFLVMTDNPPYFKQGDYALDDQGILSLPSEDHEWPIYTYGSIAVLDPDVFATVDDTIFSFGQAILPAIQTGKIMGEYYSGVMYNTNTPAECAALKKYLKEHEQ